MGAMLLAVFFIGAPSIAFAYGNDYDWTSEITVTGSGTITLPSAMLAESIFTIHGWTDSQFTALCFIKTNSFATPFSISSCNNTGILYFTVETTNTGTYPDGILGFFYVTRTSTGYYQIGSFPTVSGVDAVTSPTPQEVTPDAFPRLIYTYTNVDLFVKASARIVDLTISQNIEASPQAIISTGTGTYNQGMQLAPNHFYSVQPFIENTAGDRIYGPLVFFSTVSSQIENFQSSAATTTDAGGLFGGAFDIRSKMMHKVPFGWVSQIYSIISSSSVDGTGTLPSIALHYRMQGEPTSTIDMFSTSTIKGPHSVNFMNTVDGMLAAFIYFDAMMLTYFVARTAFSPKPHHV